MKTVLFLLLLALSVPAQWRYSAATDTILDSTTIYRDTTFLYLHCKDVFIRIVIAGDDWVFKHFACHTWQTRKTIPAHTVPETYEWETKMKGSK